ncbi:hypothetical protein Pan258_08320 [Symmachiella dynata]|nr:hypothetical protein Pan258_08320 [Symmachiella dynata]
MKVAEDPYNDDQIAICLRLAERICRNEIPKPYDAEEDEDAEDLAIDYFIALAEMANVDGEMIVLESLLAGRSWDAFFGEVGIWPLLQQAQPPFPVPTSTFFPPGVGFLPRETLHGKTEADIEKRLKDHSPPFKKPHWLWGGGASELAEINAARIEFSEMAVSVTKDKLDLLAIAMT